MSRSSGVGIYGNAIVEREVDPFDDKIRRSLDGTLSELPDTFENWSAQRVKEAALGFARADSDRIAQKANADAFLTLHKEFIDIDANGQTMNRTLEALYGDRVYSVSEFEKAYAVCRANNSLTLDQAEIVKQQQAETNQRAKAAREQRAAATRVFSEDEKDNMSLEELRAVENREIQQRMQQGGERGGNDW
jgi:type IV secretory pathway VirJ component